MQYSIARPTNILLLCLSSLYFSTNLAYATPKITLSPMETLGKTIFFDDQLSLPVGQACVSCHSPEFGFTAEDPFTNIGGAVVHGAKAKRSGNRKPPSSAYTTFASTFSVTAGRPSGGTFWDGRAQGTYITADIFPDSWPVDAKTTMATFLGPAADQAMGPLLNDVEQNIKSQAMLCHRVKQNHAADWKSVWGEALKCNQNADYELTHKRIGFAIAVWEASLEVNSFSSVFDKAIKKAIEKNGVVTSPIKGLTSLENQGRDLFFTNSIGCANFCHAKATTSNGTQLNELFTKTNAGYFNIGAPANPENPWYLMDTVKDDNGNIINPLGLAWVDLGIAGRDEDGIAGSDFPGQEGKFKVPTLRNVAKVSYLGAPKAFAHNGYFKSLKNIVHFYNTRDLKPTCVDTNGNPERFVTNDAAQARGCWPLPEVASSNIFGCDAGTGCKVVIPAGQTAETYCNNASNLRNIGNLCLTSDQEDAIVAFLGTLTDSVTAKAP